MAFREMFGCALRLSYTVRKPTSVPHVPGERLGRALAAPFALHVIGEEKMV